MAIFKFLIVGAMVVLGGAPAGAATPPTLPPAALPSPPASDDELLGVLATIHAVSREAAAPGRTRGTSREVRALAETITRHAAAGQRRLRALSVQTGLRASGGDTSDGLRFAARRALAELPAEPRGAGFDEIWLKGQIEALMLGIGAVNNEARPYAQAPGLRAELVTVVEQAAADLAAAEALRAALAGSTRSGESALVRGGGQ
ncbi:DUF4142 domain-containing protein [Nannocystis bainbridge]|uniref:DUF4142 domain-containing protein n=1 Tax=Nannocystis bainbridge TaxID=2995303 RepID=A0ABT5E9A9_9BACT|nr:DUF4142 domain-containing protein [Nannocystis bainbridge]MDC0721351.1 DUF4142 domain-containing protein [Nannocystis bainbridge]